MYQKYISPIFNKTHKTRNYFCELYAREIEGNKVEVVLTATGKGLKAKFCPVEIPKVIYKKHWRKIVHELFRGIRHSWGIDKSNSNC